MDNQSIIEPVVTYEMAVDKKKKHTLEDSKLQVQYYTDELNNLLQKPTNNELNKKITKSRGKLIKWQKILINCIKDQETKKMEKQNLKALLIDHRTHLKNVVHENKGKNLLATQGARLNLIGNAIRSVAHGDFKEKTQGVMDVVHQTIASVPWKIVVPVVIIGTGAHYAVELYNNTLKPIVDELVNVKNNTGETINTGIKQGTDAVNWLFNRDAKPVDFSNIIDVFRDQFNSQVSTIHQSNSGNWYGGKGVGF